MNKVELYLIREFQKVEFNVEYNSFSEGKPISNKSKLRLLNLFLDVDMVLRVGGRLALADLKFAQKHQYIMPAKGKLYKLIADHYHKRYFYISPQALLHYLRQKFWSLRVKKLARKITHESVTCSKNNSITVKQILGSLPTQRVSPSTPLNYVGTDFGASFL